MKISKEIMTPLIKELYLEFSKTRNLNSFLEKISNINNNCPATDNFGINLLLLQTYFQLYVNSAKNNEKRLLEKIHYILTVENFVEYVFEIASKNYEKETLSHLFGSKRNLFKRIENISYIYYNKNLI